MCSFLVTNKEVQDLEAVNRFQKMRGPDLTNTTCVEGVTFVHNLLSITGEVTPQPFTEEGVVALFNGEIYNYRSFGNVRSDGEVIVPSYRKDGVSCIQKFDGEFAIVIIDQKTKSLILATDAFGTKPLFYARDGKEFGVASYQSALKKLGFKHIERIPENTICTYDLETGRVREKLPVHTFSCEQKKHTYDDFIRAYEEAIRKRSKGLTKKIFLGLSSGYDSGAIACELSRQQVDFKVFSIKDGENDAILQERLKRHSSTEVLSLNAQDFLCEKNFVKWHVEDFFMSIMPERGRGDYVSNNTGAVGLSHICRRARTEEYKVLFSGQGADEIFSDYGWKGTKYAGHSSFGGSFPDDLTSVFPWRNFFGGVQRAYLDKEEAIAGMHGIETRYPFLDTALVQEFLWLAPELKNAHYKAPLFAYLTKRAYPFEDGEKIGFTPRSLTKSEKWGPRSLWYNFVWRLIPYLRKVQSYK